MDPVSEAITKLREIRSIRSRKDRTIKATAILIGLLGNYISRNEQLDLVEALNPLVK